jgi:hypothetical protein
MISAILRKWLWINIFIGMFLFSSTRKVINRVNWQMESEIGPTYGCFVQRTCCDQSKTWGHDGTSINSNSSVESIFSHDNICSGYRNGTNSLQLGEIHLGAWDLYSKHTVGIGVQCNWKRVVRYTWESSWRRSIWAPPKGGEAATVTCIEYQAHIIGCVS